MKFGAVTLCVTAVVAAAAVCGLAAAAPGVRGSMSQGGINYAREVVIPLIESKFSTITLPDISFEKDSIEGSVTDLTCSGIHLGSSTTALKPNAGLFFGIGDVAASCTANWSYREKIWPHIPHGSGDVDADSTSSSAIITVDLLDHNGVPNIKASGCSASVQISHLEFHGGLSGDILNLLKGLIESHLEDALDSTLCSVLGDWLNKDANTILDSFTLSVPIKLPAPLDAAIVNFGFTNNPTITAGYIGIDLVGDVTVPLIKTPPPFAPPSLPQFSSETGQYMVQTFLSTYTLETATWAFFEGGLFKFTVTPALVPASSPVKLNTTNFSVIAPGMASKYPDMGIDIVMSATTAPVMQSSPAGFNVSVGMAFAFQPVTKAGPEQAFTINCTIATSLTASVKSVAGREHLVADLRYIHCPLALQSTSVGTVQVMDIQGLVDFILPTLALPAINKLLANGFPLPVIEGLSFTDAVVAFGPSYIQVATDVQWDPAASPLRFIPGYSFSVV